MPTAFLSLLRALADSQRELETHVGGPDGATVRPILTRRRRALSVLRAAFMTGDPSEGWPRPAADGSVDMRDLQAREQGLLALYDALLREVPAGSEIHAVLRDQRSETEQARWSLLGLRSGPGPGAGNQPETRR